MLIGVLRLTLQIPGARSLKDKRRAVRSLKDRVQSRLRASIAEVGALDEHRRAILGVAVVSNDAARIDELLSAAASMAGNDKDAVLIDRASEIVTLGAEGKGVGPFADAEPEAWR